MKIAIAAVIVKNSDERVGNVNVHQVRDNQITCPLYHMKYYKAIKKHDWIYIFIALKGSTLWLSDKMCVLFRPRKSYGNKYLKLLRLIIPKGCILR